MVFATRGERNDTMKKIYANVMIQNESTILPHVYNYWKNYPVDKWIFYDDCSTDNTVEVIKDLFGNKAEVIENKDANFSECRNRSAMLESSRSAGADFVLAIDADELLSSTVLEHWDVLLNELTKYDVQLYWYNVVDSVQKIRQDSMYLENFRTFFVPLKSSQGFDMTQHKYHTPRTPQINLPQARSKDFGVIHLQSINRRYYALKQLWYKHYEHKTWNHPIEYINARYDPVVNNLNFNEAVTPKEICDGITFDASIYDEIEKVKGYKEYILSNLTPSLITFGEEYLK